MAIPTLGMERTVADAVRYLNRYAGVGADAYRNPLSREARWDMWVRTYHKNFRLTLEDEDSDPIIRSRVVKVPGAMIHLISDGQKKRVPMEIMDYLYNQLPDSLINKFKRRVYVKNLLNVWGNLINIRFPIVENINLREIGE